MNKPKLLDLFCGAGGASMGYRRAGFDVEGVDIKVQPNYKFKFYQADALDFPLEGYDAFHASPPCQAFTVAGNLRVAQGKPCNALDLIEPIRNRLIATGKPYIIENVMLSPLKTVFMLCGSSFGLKVRRHRQFESNIMILGMKCQHKAQGRPVGIYYKMGDEIPQGGRTAKSVEEAQEAMEIIWMTWAELKEAIPPAYTEYIGKYLMQAING